MKKLLALLLAMMMVFALCACGGSGDDKAEEPAAPAADGAAPADAPEGAAAPPEGEEGASGEPTGEPVAELYPTDGYNKDLEGYKQYAIDALKSDEHAPADIVEMTVEAIEAVTDGNDETFNMMINQGRIVSYDDFVK